MKKYIFVLCTALISLFILSCKSSNEVAKGEVTEEIVENSEDGEEKKSSTVREDKKSNEDNEENHEKGYLGWIDIAVKDPEYEDGNIKIKSDSSLGTFGLFSVNEEGKASPVLSTLNEFSSTGFYLKAGKRTYKLISSKNIKTAVNEISNGLNFYYSIKNVADVSVKMNIFPSVKGNAADTMKITVNITNSGKKTESYALKAILDTILGERAKYHFYTYDEMPIKTEYSARNFKDDRWFISKDDDAALQILIDGGDVTSPELVVLANYNTLEKSEWEPNMASRRAFDTVLSYNNSAVGLYWPEVRLEPGNSTNVIFYVSLALYGKEPTGHYYVYGLKPPAKPVEEVKDKFVFPDEEKEVKVQPSVIKNYVEEDVEVIETSEDDVLPNIEFNIKKIPKDKLTPEYVQSLINRINELDKSENPDRNEILQLNAELDAILSILRQKQ